MYLYHILFTLINIYGIDCKKKKERRVATRMLLFILLLRDYAQIHFFHKSQIIYFHVYLM
jgi:hypothetical protein